MHDLTELRKEYETKMLENLKEILSKNFKDIETIEKIDRPLPGYFAAGGGIEWEGQNLYLSVWVARDGKGPRQFRIEKLGNFLVNPVKGGK